MEVAIGIIIIAGVGYAVWQMVNPNKVTPPVAAVNDQITDAVTQAEKPAKKAATKKPAAKKATTKKASAKK